VSAVVVNEYPHIRLINLYTSYIFHIHYNILTDQFVYPQPILSLSPDDDSIR
jgi:hypothetical protein